MSQENVDLVRRTTEAWNSGGVEALLPFYAKDVAWYAFSEAPDYRGGFHGHDGIRELTSNWTDSFDEFAIFGHEYRDFGDRVVALGEISGKIKGSDVAISQPVASIASGFRDGKIGEQRFYRSWDEALYAANSSE